MCGYDYIFLNVRRLDSSQRRSKESQVSETGSLCGIVSKGKIIGSKRTVNMLRHWYELIYSHSIFTLQVVNCLYINVVKWYLSECVSLDLSWVHLESMA